MRKILILLTALVALAAIPSLASADVSNPTYTPDHSASTDLGQTCRTQPTTGVFGQYGAQGFFVDGCTATVRCPSYARSCNLYGYGYIGESGYLNDSMNARLRMFTSQGSIISWKDTSCYQYRGCTTPKLAGTLGPGGIGTLQCNGVRWTTSSNVPYGSAVDSCHVELFENFV